MAFLSDLPLLTIGLVVSSGVWFLIWVLWRLMTDTGRYKTARRHR